MPCAMLLSEVWPNHHKVVRGAGKLQVVARNNRVHGLSGVNGMLLDVHVPGVKRGQAVDRSLTYGIMTMLTTCHCLKQRVNMVVSSDKSG